MLNGYELFAYILFDSIIIYRIEILGETYVTRSNQLNIRTDSLNLYVTHLLINTQLFEDLMFFILTTCIMEIR